MNVFSARVILATILVIAVALLPGTYGVYAVALLPLLALYAMRAGVSAKRLFRGIGYAVPFVAGASLGIFLRPGGLFIALSTATKALVCIVVVQLINQTTPYPELLRLLQKARVPPLLIETLSLLNRYVPVLSSEVERMRRARAARTFQNRRRATWWLSASAVGLLFVRSVGRAERIDSAMRSRSFS